MLGLNNNIQSVTKTLFLNVCSVILLQGISFFTAPIFTRLLGPEQYGIYSVFNAWVSILTCFMGLQVGSALATGRYQFKESYQSFKSSILLLGTIISGVILALIICFVGLISKWIGYSSEIVLCMFFLAFARFVTSFAQNAWAYEKKAQINFIVSVMVTFTTVGLSLLWVYNISPDKRYLGKIYGNVVPHVIAAIIIWFIIFLKKPAGVNLKYWRYSLALGGPVVFHLLSKSVLNQSDRVMMRNMGVGDFSIGIYSVFYGLVDVLNIILSALNTSWCPFYYDDLDNKLWKKLDSKCRNYIEVFTVLSCGFILLSREVGYFYAGKEYYVGINIIPVLVLAIFFVFMYQFPVNFEFFHKKTDIIALGTISAAVANIILNKIMIPIWGMYGAAIATALSYALLFLAHYFIVMHLKNQKFHLNIVVFIPGLLMILLATVLFYLMPARWYVRWGVGAALGILELYRIWKRKGIF